MYQKAGRRLAIDYGDVRIGVAMSDVSGVIASPLETIENGDNFDKAQQRISKICSEEQVSVIYIGLPLHLSGEEGSSALKVRDFARGLTKYLPNEIVVRMIDERLTTSSAHKRALDTGRKLTKFEIDQFAAVAILENALRTEKSRGDFAGSPLE